jgi:peptidoglycan/LPS O-acetylase OafA/YrhL
MSMESQTGRNTVFDILRIVFATLVILAHAPEMLDGNRSRELFVRLTHSSMTLGDLSVDGFFLLSGFLIVKSWERNPTWADFLRNRTLRIVPGYLVAALLSTAVVGLLALVPHPFFIILRKCFLLASYSFASQ